jgi:hypothetical protein
MAQLSYNDLQAFFLVARERSFTRAVGKLGPAHFWLLCSAGGASISELTFSSIAL